MSECGCKSDQQVAQERASAARHAEVMLRWARTPGTRAAIVAQALNTIRLAADCGYHRRAVSTAREVR